VAHTVQDEGFHEIQLNGKQLVFLFMAATVVSVVIFLCGVLVGRGVRAERGGVAENTSIAGGTETTPQPAPAPPTQPPAGSDPTTAAAPPPVDDLSYFSRLEKSKAPLEHLKPTPGERASTPVPAEKGTAGPAPKAAETPRREPARPPAADAASEEPAGQGFAVQIAALNVRSEADAIAKRLSSKGYAAYVISPANGTPTVYRVRVGKFTTRREAETIAAKLQKEEQFRPWVTR
jgi:septal ring-binding cell division protein DamX